jgi:hypothetical protein
VGISLTNPVFLAALTAAAVPLIIHLIHQRRSRTINFPSLMFLKLVDLRVARRQRLKELLLMALRMALIAFVVLALARPVLTGGGANGRSASAGAVFLVDDSCSMATRRNGAAAFARAVEGLQKALTTFSEGDQVAVVTLCQTAKQEPSFDGDLARVKNMLDSLEYTASTADLRPALKRAYALLEKSTAPNREIYIATDLQKLHWDALANKDAFEEFDPAVTVFLLDAGGASGANLAVTGVALSPGDKPLGLAVDVTVRNFSNTSVPAMCALTWDGERVAEGAADIPAGSEGVLRLAVDEVVPGPHRGGVTLADDALAADNVRFFTTDRLDAVPVLLVNGAPGATEYDDEVFYLERALDPGFAASASCFRPETATNRFSNRELSRFPIMILANVGRLPKGARGVLASYVSGGGGLLIFPGDKVRPRIYEKLLAGLLPAKLGEPYGAAEDRKRERDRAFTLDPDLGHPAMRVFAAEDSAFSDARFWRAFALTPAKNDGAKVLARFSNTDCALVERRVGKGRVILAAFPADAAWTNLPLKSAYLPLMHQLCRYAAGLEEVHGEFLVGAPVVLPFAAENASCVAPSGRELAATLDAESGRVSFEPAVEPGIYRLVDAGGAEARERLFAVNVDTRESSPERIGIDAVKQALPAEHFIVLRDTLEIPDAIRTHRHGTELFLLFLLLALAAFIAECWLANRLTPRAQEEPDVLDDLGREAPGVRSGAHETRLAKSAQSGEAVQ